MDLGGWLRSLGLERYEAAFRENKIDSTIQSMPNLTGEDLKDLGVGIVGYCREMLDAVDLLCVDASAPMGDEDENDRNSFCDVLVRECRYGSRQLRGSGRL
jgi:hypothetical protein